MFRSLLLAASLGLSSAAMAVGVGEKAPSFSLPTLGSGQSMGLSKYKGRVVYVDFWASWCGPCRESLPMLNELRNELKRKGFEVLAINLDENTDDAKAFLKQFPVSYPVLLDPEGRIPEKYELPGMPTSFMIDKKGNVAKIHVGFKAADMPQIRKDVIKLLKQR